MAVLILAEKVCQEHAVYNIPLALISWIFFAEIYSMLALIFKPIDFGKKDQIIWSKFFKNTRSMESIENQLLKA